MVSLPSPTMGRCWGEAVDRVAPGQLSPEETGGGGSKRRNRGGGASRSRGPSGFSIGHRVPEHGKQPAAFGPSSRWMDAPVWCTVQGGGPIGTDRWEVGGRRSGPNGPGTGKAIRSSRPASQPSATPHPGKPRGSAQGGTGIGVDKHPPLVHDAGPDHRPRRISECGARDCASSTRARPPSPGLGSGSGGAGPERPPQPLRWHGVPARVQEEKGAGVGGEGHTCRPGP